MDAERWEQIEGLFLGALDREAGERGVFLDAACAGDAAMRAEVEAMLEAHERSQALLLENRFFTGDPDVLPDPGTLIGTRIGAYRLVRLLGEGGMGAVYLAERDDAQYRQHVALKLIRPGLHSADVVTRFRVERQILASLNHPSIVDDRDLAEADQLTREALEIARSVFDPANPVVSNTLNMRAQLLQKRGALGEAQVLFEEALATARRAFPEGHPRIGWAQVGLGSVLFETGRPRDAERQIRAGWHVLIAAFGREHPLTQQAEARLAAVLKTLGRTDELDTLRVPPPPHTPNH